MPHPRISAYTHIHLCTPEHTCAHPCTPVHIRAHPHTPEHTHAHRTYPHTPAHTHTHLRTHSCTAAHTQAHTQAHLLTPVHTHAQLRTPTQFSAWPCTPFHNCARPRIRACQCTLIITLKVTHRNLLNLRKHQNFDFHKKS